MMGGFGLSGIPENLIAALHRRGTKDLTIISNNAGTDTTRDRPAAPRSPGAEDDCDLRRREQGIRAPVPSEGNRGRAGAPRHVFGAYARRGRGHSRRSTRRRATALSSPRARKRRRSMAATTSSSVRCTRTSPSSKRGKGDQVGNLTYRRTARNFNPVMATAARFTIAEVEHLVKPGEIDPDLVHTPGIYVKRVLQGRDYEKTDREADAA